MNKRVGILVVALALVGIAVLPQENLRGSTPSGCEDCYDYTVYLGLVKRHVFAPSATGQVTAIQLLGDDMSSNIIATGTSESDSHTAFALNIPSPLVRGDDEEEDEGEYEEWEEDGWGRYEGESSCGSGGCGVSHTSYYKKTCGFFHQACLMEDGAAKIATLYEGSVKDDATAMIAVLKVESKAFTINAKRRSIQATDCDGAVVANIPLSAALYAKLVNAL